MHTAPMSNELPLRDVISARPGTPEASAPGPAFGFDRPLIQSPTRVTPTLQLRSPTACREIYRFRRRRTTFKEWHHHMMAASPK